LLAAPPGTPEPPVPSGEWPALQTALHQVAVEWEIMDPREVNFVFARQENFVSDLNLLRQRYQDLADAPRAWDAQRFPDRGSVNELVTFNRNFRKHLETQQLIEPDRAAVFRQAARETDRLYEIYNAVR